jgi:hypothetical protein
MTGNSGNIGHSSSSLITNGLPVFEVEIISIRDIKNSDDTITEWSRTRNQWCYYQSLLE